MSEKDVFDLVLEKYGAVGIVVAAIATCVTFCLWVAASAVYIWPIVTPIALFGYMAWSVRK